MTTRLRFRTCIEDIADLLLANSQPRPPEQLYKLRDEAEHLSRDMGYDRPPLTTEGSLEPFGYDDRQTFERWMFDDGQNVLTAARLYPLDPEEGGQVKESITRVDLAQVEAWRQKWCARADQHVEEAPPPQEQQDAPPPAYTPNDGDYIHPKAAAALLGLTGDSKSNSAKLARIRDRAGDSLRTKDYGNRRDYHVGDLQWLKGLVGTRAVDEWSDSEPTEQERAGIEARKASLRQERRTE